MCGIVGYIGNKKAIDVLLEGLTNLEYRGYDSAGVAVNVDGKVELYKAEGKLQNLKNIVEKNYTEISKSTIGIGHIRWATHGAPTVINAHPHTCNCGKVAVVHNGIIENFKELRAKLEKQGCTFRSQTDTETVAHLVATKYAQTKDLTEAVRLATKEIEGAYALCVIHQDVPNTIVATRRNAPLVVGLGEGENFVASDVPALIQYTKKAMYLDDNQIVTLKPDSYKVIDIDKNPLTLKVETLPWEPVALSKMGYKHFMLKEIHEQPDVVRNVLSGKLHAMDEDIILKEVTLDKDKLKNLSRIQIVACGTSLHAAMVGKYLIEDFCGIPVDVEPSSEYIYRKTVTNDKPLVIGDSQSGETADTITAIRQAKEKGLAMPVHIFLSGKNPPDEDVHCFENVETASDEEIVSFFSANALSSSVPAPDEELAKFLSLILCTDVRMAEKYKATPDDVKFDCDITVLYGTEDTLMQNVDMNSWSRFTNGKCEVYPFKGGHFYYSNQKKEVCDIINEKLGLSNL